MGIVEEKAALEKKKNFHEQELIKEWGENKYKNLLNEIKDLVIQVYEVSILLPNRTYTKIANGLIKDTNNDKSLTHTESLYKQFILLGRLLFG